ncbi:MULTISPECIES: Hsp70 family protein [unclassified Ruegeria]|uniref:Hsp70 family protein n=1 Tax=unclassified Ruegeria TaxID=2625375 RepID=UPI00149183E9|nr:MULTISPECIES: Hsp70 family protein [unclassified Ruegeria]NOD36508.1 Hsp70 family protein [Ruegeria sp. HKCCD7296]NOE43747.1 Hsp70 family protein [Ruegeria sp. HKCCD7319]
MAPFRPWIGIDFGTSNSAVAYVVSDVPRLVHFDAKAQTLPTTFFFDFETRESLIGEPANRALLDGLEGRFMRALKRVLGTTLMHEKRQILNERLTFVEIIGSFLRKLKERAEAELGVPCTRVVSGRPVVFHGQNDPREEQAEADLRACYDAAGFTEVRFCPEPAAAASYPDRATRSLCAASGSNPCAGRTHLAGSDHFTLRQLAEIRRCCAGSCSVNLSIRGHVRLWHILSGGLDRDCHRIVICRPFQTIGRQYR